MTSQCAHSFLSLPISGCRGKWKTAASWAVALSVALCFGTDLGAQEKKSESQDKEPVIEAPKGLPHVPRPDDNPPTRAKIELGKQLYFDARLSSDNSISCASCHSPGQGYSNGAPVATGVGGEKGGRNAPTLINTAYNEFQFWDGRADGLEDQALGPIQNPIEMNMNLEDLEKKLNAVEGYRKQFQTVFGTEVTAENIAKAVATFERTILSGNTPYDRYKAGDEDALSEAAKRGLELFKNKAQCTACHKPPLFTDNAFHNIGVGWNKEDPDPGRKNVIPLAGFTGAFKTPTVREAGKTAPYMHDGSMETLEEVMEHYNKGGIENPYLDEDIKKLNLTDQEIADVITFMTEGLSSPDYPRVEPPELPE